MSMSSKLLKRGYNLIDVGQLQNAEMVIDAVVRADPQNVTAWKAYLQVYQYNANLPWLVERINNTNELSDKSKGELRAYLEFLKHSMDCPTVPVEAVNAAQPAPSVNGEVVFELIDEYEIPTRPVERVHHKKDRPIFKYAIPAYVWQALGLLMVFYLGIRLLVGGSGLGYLLLGIFIFGSIFWFRSLADQKSGLSLPVQRAYAMETEHELTAVEKKAAEKKKNSKKNPRVRYLDE